MVLSDRLLSEGTVRKSIRRGVLVTRHPSLFLKRITYNIRRFISDVSSSLGYYDYPHRIIFLAGMAMGGSTWMKNLLARIPGYFSRYMPIPRDVAYRQ
ncbi:hypothetical protein KAR91_84410, partial [Candidatus Pacearchaeota archaeon]|nr:hypothetical protein [Candidatus Pacearchaeota archaeon]